MPPPPLEPRPATSEESFHQASPPLREPTPNRRDPDENANHHQTTEPPVKESDHLARTALSRFFLNGVSFSNWYVFQVADDFRLAYIGTPVSNLAHLVDLRRSHSVPSRDSQTEPGQETTGDQPPYGGIEVQAWQQIVATPTRDQSQPSNLPLHYPYPQIRPLNSWYPKPQNFLHPSQDLVKDLSSFPQEEVREALVKAYFDHIHPIFPVLTPSTFLRRDGSLKAFPPLLLYQAILLAGAHVCTHPRVVKERWLVKSVLFRRASMLFHLRHETDRLHLTQAALLFTWHIQDGDTVAGGPWYWTGVAVRISCGQGAHRHNSQLPMFERIMYKRSWWCAFVSEVFSALETGRPCAFRAEDIDQSLPTQEELDWDQPQDASVHHVEPASDSEAHPVPSTSPPLKYHGHIIELAYIVLDILTLNAPSSTQTLDVPRLEGRLALWSLRAGLASNPRDEDFFTCQLRLYYNMVVLNLHRNYRTGPPASQTTCSTASESIIAALERIAALDALGRSHFLAVSAVTAAGIQIVQDIRSAVITGAYLVCLNRLERLAHMIYYARILSRSWPNAEAVCSVFEGLRKDYEDQVAQGLNPMDDDTHTPDAEPDWDSLFASMKGPEAGRPITEEEWANLMTWADSL
ncbi:hypothetical protein A1O3_02466 [Capronia epimyces CBS 606.96]|uniref:Xylanolytic transcriptional activator regulatory domain-containing protein n=1 Tax=Capronia epimyces CBS 606.96 TaxID=1182542 RepID=W9Z4I8_9EURO|nr:uncharacterized protein A1O3_02466 [Capronia epimyces CBS 606.96]EXJ89399.1 hypothetical protein A1O3_02466 [Capronia epimyces CBS 606.96]